jgi:hypothetical protein
MIAELVPDHSYVIKVRVKGLQQWSSLSAVMSTTSAPLKATDADNTEPCIVDANMACESTTGTWFAPEADPAAVEASGDWTAIEQSHQSSAEPSKSPNQSPNSSISSSSSLVNSAVLFQDELETLEEVSMSCTDGNIMAADSRVPELEAALKLAEKQLAEKSAELKAQAAALLSAEGVEAERLNLEAKRRVDEEQTAHAATRELLAEKTRKLAEKTQQLEEKTLQLEESSATTEAHVAARAEAAAHRQKHQQRYSAAMLAKEAQHAEALQAKDAEHAAAMQHASERIDELTRGAEAIKTDAADAAEEMRKRFELRTQQLVEEQITSDTRIAIMEREVMAKEFGQQLRQKVVQIETVREEHVKMKQVIFEKGQELRALRQEIQLKANEQSEALQQTQVERSCGAQKLSFESFSPGDVALFFPTCTSNGPSGQGASTPSSYVAFHKGCPNQFLSLESVTELARREDGTSPSFIIGTILLVDEAVAEHGHNPHKLQLGTKFSSLVVAAL